jgi:hypothetical protein
VASTQNVDAGLKIGLLNKQKSKASSKDPSTSQRFSGALVANKRHNPAATVQQLPPALRPDVARLPPQGIPVTPSTTSNNALGYHQFSSPAFQAQPPGIDVLTLRRMQNRSLRDSLVLAVVHDVETGENERIPTAASEQAKKRFKSLTRDNRDAALTFAQNMVHVRPDADSQETCRAYDEIYGD